MLDGKIFWVLLYVVAWVFEVSIIQAVGLLDAGCDVFLLTNNFLWNPLITSLLGIHKFSMEKYLQRCMI